MTIEHQLGNSTSRSQWSDAKHYWYVLASASSCFLGNFRLCSPFLDILRQFNDRLSEQLSASPTSQRTMTALIISSLPIEISVFSLRLLINDKQQQIYNTPTWCLPAPTSNTFKSVLGVLKAWYETAQPSSWG